MVGVRLAKVVKVTDRRRDLVLKVPPGLTEAESTASLIVKGVAANTSLTRVVSHGVFGQDLDVTTLHGAMVATAQRVNAGSLEDAEALLMSQAVSLNALFVELAQRAHAAKSLDHFETNLRLALRSQSQCRTTCEALALLKNPPVFARQANISHGPQQVNNGPILDATRTRAEISESAPNKLLEAPEDAERVDGRATSEAGDGDSAVEAVGTIDRTENPGREGRVSQNGWRDGERPQLRAQAKELAALLWFQRRAVQLTGLDDD